ncbi:MAG: Mut7-C RNAse domain-containing protein [Chloroflexi bacterium]|nr:Mut7-C RNAse domain-containing protein [Chloroflexota bacterium]
MSQVLDLYQSPKESFDTLFFNEPDDGKMVKMALGEDRTIITRDSEFMKRRAITSGRVQAILVSGNISELQMQAVINKLKLSDKTQPFTRCLECNTVLKEMDRSEAAELVPARVYEIQHQYMACPSCLRIYWRGTHWKAMNNKLHEFDSTQPEGNEGEWP